VGQEQIDQLADPAHHLADRPINNHMAALYVVKRLNSVYVTESRAILIKGIRGFKGSKGVKGFGDQIVAYPNRATPIFR
jgi:hypothetical protein